LQGRKEVGFKRYAMKNERSMGIKTALKIYKTKRRANMAPKPKINFANLSFSCVT